MPRFLLINPRAGAPTPDVDALVRAASELDVRCHLLSNDDDPAELARQAAPGALGIAGGDGSLAAVAAVAVDRDLPFVCIPFGTRNHFARDLGLDRGDPFGALGGFDGVERRIDVGRVGKRLFLNNVSLGVYAGLVHQREHHRRRGEALAGLRALKRIAADRHRLHARLDGEPLTTRILLVANNRYEVDLFTLGERVSLEEGRLHVYAAHGWLPRHWSNRGAEGFELELDAPNVRAAIDGEPTVLEPPLVFASLPRSLRVLVPPA
ncbi:MAG: diacylglycerol kinase family protein [Gaiellaceae bacterium]